MENAQEKLLKEITCFLREQNIPYMITGAWSVIFWGGPRASHDIDFVVELSKKDIKKTEKAFKILPDEFLIQTGVVEEAVTTSGFFNVLHLPTMLKMDFWLLEKNAFDKSRFLRRRKEIILDQEMFVASPEDTIIQKLRWYKEGKIEKHLVDAAFVYNIQKKNLNTEYLDKWIEKLGLLSLFKEMKEVKLENFL